MVDVPSSLVTDDLEPSSVIPDVAADPPKNKGGRPRSTVRPDEAGAQPRNLGGRKTNAQIEAEAEAAKEKLAAAERKRVEEMRTKIRETCIDVVNPLPAKNARSLLQVPANMGWIQVVAIEGEDGPEPALKKNGMPQYNYINGAQFVILQPDEIEMLAFIGPYALQGEVSEKTKATLKKAAPFVALGGALMFAANYAIRLKQTKVVVDDLVKSLDIIDGD